MNRFWNTLIQPILSELKPGAIVEIGSDWGANTRLLLEFCTTHGSGLHVVDPLPKLDPESLKAEYRDHFRLYRTLSLNGLSRVEHSDVVLVDGDHNWYTVYHELQLIEKLCRDRRSGFPLVLLHDVGWPYGRRDLYYNPENIPPAYRKPFARKGLHPNSPELLDDGGLNVHLDHAIHESNVQNGVPDRDRGLPRDDEARPVLSSQLRVSTASGS